MSVKSRFATKIERGGYSTIIFKEGDTYVADDFVGTTIKEGTNPATTIQAGIDSLSMGNVFIKGETYANDAALTMKTKVNLIGEGECTKLYRATGDIITGASVVQTTIANMALFGNRGGANHRGIYFDSNSERNTMQNLQIEMLDIGIEIGGGYFNFITDMRMRDITNKVIYLTGGNDHYLTRIQYDTDTGAYAQPTGGGIYITNGDAVVLTDSDLIHAGKGIVFIPTTTTRSHKLQNSFFDSCSGAGIAFPNCAGTVMDVHFDEIWSATNNRGILIDGANQMDGIIFNNVDLHNNVNEGARITSANLDHLVFNGGEFAGNNQGAGTASNLEADFSGDVVMTNLQFGRFFGWGTTVFRHITIGSNQTSARISNCFLDTHWSQDSIYSAITGVIGDEIVKATSSLVLSGGSSDINIFHAGMRCALLRYDILYTEASSADAGVALRIGRYQDGVAWDDDYFDAVTSEVSKNLGYVKTIKNSELTNKEIAKGDSITVGTAGGKTGTGQVTIVLYLVKLGI
jgi:hypothetical protein